MENEIKNSEIEMSLAINELATSLSAFQGQVEAVKKDAENPFFRSKYASLAGIMETIRKPLSENGLAVTQFPLPSGQLTTILMHKSGQFIKATYSMNPKDGSPQALGSTLTYARRYAISAVLGIATEDDDDGNVASGKVEEKTAKDNPKVYTPTYKKGVVTDKPSKEQEPFD